MRHTAGRKRMVRCSQRAATPAVGVASGCRTTWNSCCGVSELPEVAAQCNGGFRVQIPAARPIAFKDIPTIDFSDPAFWSPNGVQTSRSNRRRDVGRAAFTSSIGTSGPAWADSPRLASQVKLIGAKVNAARLPRTIPLAPSPQSRLRYAEFRPAYCGRRLHEGVARRTSTSIPTNLWAGTVRFAVTCNLAPHSR
jgi:hypothetical protein